jgi:uncharacterized protein (DUF305 family)
MKGSRYGRYVVKRLAISVVVPFLLAGCSGSGHPAAAESPRPSFTYHMASPPAYKLADVQFADRVYLYVSGALSISAQARGRALDPRVLQLASGMSSELSGSKQELLGWFSAWGKRLPGGVSPSARGWPGLPSQAAVRQLEALRGSAFDRMFLKLVIADQQGMLAAATLEQEGGVFGSARQLASQLVSSSTLTIVHMKQLLNAVVL